MDGRDERGVISYLGYGLWALTLPAVAAELGDRDSDAEVGGGSSEIVAGLSVAESDLLP